MKSNFQIHHQTTGSIPQQAVLEDVRHLRDTTESIFLSTGEQLIEIAMLLETAIAAFNTLVDLGRDDLMHKLRAKALAQEDSFEVLRNGFVDAGNKISGLTSMLCFLDREFHRVRRSVTTTRFVVVNAKTVLASIPSQQQRLGHLTKEGTRVVEEMEHLLSNFERTLHEIGQSVRRMDQVVSLVGSTVDNDVRSAFDALISDIADFESSFQMIAGAGAAMSNRLKDIQAATAKAVAGLQVGDSTRQRLDHVAFVLENALSENSPLHDLAAVLLEDAFLEQTEKLDQLKNSVASMIAGLRDLVQSHLMEFSGATERTLNASSLLGDAEQIAASVEVLRPLQDKAGQTYQTLDAELNRFNGLIRQNEEVQVKIRHIGMDAVLACTRLGDDGKPLKVVAEQIQIVAEESGDHFGSIRGTMKEISELGRSVASETEEMVKQSIQVPANLSADFGPLITQVVESFSPIQSIIMNLKGKTAAVKFDFAPAQAHTAQLERLASQIPRFIPAEKTELVLDSVLEKIFSGFTIERERDVFRNIFPAQSIAANSASQTATGATLDEFFF